MVNYRKGTFILSCINSCTSTPFLLLPPMSYLLPKTHQRIFSTKADLFSKDSSSAVKIKRYPMEQLPFSFPICQGVGLLIKEIHLGYCIYKIIFTNMTRSFFLNQKFSAVNGGLGSTRALPFPSRKCFSESRAFSHA